MPGVFVPGNDPDAIYEAAGEAIARARAGGGPTLIELETHRLEGHFVGDTVGYRTAAGLERTTTVDPITLSPPRLTADGHDAEALDELVPATVDVAESTTTCAQI